MLIHSLESGVLKQENIPDILDSNPPGLGSDTCVLEDFVWVIQVCMTLTGLKQMFFSFILKILLGLCNPGSLFLEQRLTTQTEVHLQNLGRKMCPKMNLELPCTFAVMLNIRFQKKKALVELS